MIGALSRFAESSPAVHVAPGTDFTLFGLHVTNSMLYGWIVMIVLILLLTAAAKRVRIKPVRGAVQYVEAGVDFVRNLVINSFNDKSVGRKYVPFFVTLFFIVLLNNWSGLIPIVGEGVQSHGHPLFRPWTADLNATLAMGLVTMVFVYTASVRELGGLFKYLGHFFMGKNPLYIVIGFIEMMTDLTRTFSLALRLFLNVTIGEIVIAVFAYLGGLLAPASVLSPLTSLPFTLLELGVGALQAYIFVILGVNYLAISVNSAHDHDDAHDLTETTKAEKIRLHAEELGGAGGA